MIEVLKKNGHEISAWHLGIGDYDAPPSSSSQYNFSLFRKQIMPDVVMADYSWMANVFDVVPKDVLKDLKFVFVEHMDEVLGVALTKRLVTAEPVQRPTLHHVAPPQVD